MSRFANAFGPDRPEATYVPHAFPEQGFDPAVGIFVGSTGSLDARGTSILTPNELGVRQGRVLDGGSITLSPFVAARSLPSGVHPSRTPTQPLSEREVYLGFT
mgnify:CR=1 FL=1